MGKRPGVLVARIGGACLPTGLIKRLTVVGRYTILGCATSRLLAHGYTQWSAHKPSSSNAGTTSPRFSTCATLDTLDPTATTMNKPTLVSIGLPTYNRAVDLKRAIDSALSQDYANFELIISDNASTDGTQILCEEFCRQDTRVRYIRQPHNKGPGENFRSVRLEARGEFFMWLADDDWLDPSYISRCLEVLIEQPDYSLACGRGKYFKDGAFSFDEVDINLLENSGAERVLSFYRQVGMNGLFYGLMRRKAIELPTRWAMGGDWILVAHLAFEGKVVTLPEVSINRSLIGASQDIKRLARFAGLTGFMANNPHLWLGIAILKDINSSPVFDSMGRLARLNLGARSGMAVVSRYCMPDWRARLERAWSDARARVALRTRIKMLLSKLSASR